jgi:hypothetical protein
VAGGASAAQALEGALAAQHAIHGLGHEGPVAGAELAEIAEVAGQHRVGGVVEAQHGTEGLAGGLDLGGVMVMEIRYGKTAGRCCARQTVH